MHYESKVLHSYTNSSMKYPTKHLYYSNRTLNLLLPINPSKIFLFYVFRNIYKLIQKLKNAFIHKFRSQWTQHLEARAITKTLTMSKNFSSLQKFFPLIKRKTFPFFKSYLGKFFTFLILCRYSRGI